MVGRDVVPFAALLVEPEPPLALLPEVGLLQGFCCKVWDHARESVGWTSLRGQSEHLVDQLRLPDHVALRHPSRLSLAERMHDLDAAQGPPRRGE